jgi:hypothetical protein
MRMQPFHPVQVLSFLLTSALVLLGGCAYLSAQTPTSHPGIGNTILSTPSNTPSIATATPYPTAVPTLDPAIEPKAITSLGKGAVPSVYLSPDRKMFITFLDGQLSLFDAVSLQKIGIIPDIVQIDGIYFSRDSHYAAVRGVFGAPVVDLTNRKIVGWPSGSGFGPISGFSFSADDKYAAYKVSNMIPSASYDYIALFDVTSGDELPHKKCYFVK